MNTGAAREAIRYDVAGTVVSLRSEDAEWRRRAAQRYAGFAVDAPAHLEIDYEVTQALPAPDGHPPHVPLQAHSYELHLAAPPFLARVASDRRHAWIEGPLETFPVDILLRDLLPELVADGVILHGCGLAQGDQGFVCSGPSGSGKSTLGSLFPDRLLSDELVAVAGAGASPTVRALPYWSGQPGSARLAAIHVIRHGSVHERHRLSMGAGMRALLPHVLWPVHSEPAVARTFSAVTAIASRVPVFDLAFLPRPDVWAAIAEDLS